MRSLTPKPQSSTLKIIIIFLFLGLALLLLKSNISSSSSSSSSSNNTINGGSLLLSSSSSPNCPSTCTKIPPSLSSTIIHYATSRITPQQSLREISITETILRRISPCNFLVFGLGYDSPMWAALNHAGRTVFLEENVDWIKQITLKFPTLESRHVTYDTQRRQSNQLMKAAKADPECRKVSDPRSSQCKLANKGFPKEVYEVEWDVIMVDAPTGYIDKSPGRMSAIYTAGLMARNRAEGDTDVLVHDVDRDVEDTFSVEFLCEGYKVTQEGRLRHFNIPSHRTRIDVPFCPTPKPQ